MNESDDVGQDTQLIPAGLGHVICGEDPGDTHREIPGCECAGAEFGDGGWWCGFYGWVGGGSVDALEVRGVFVALGGVYDCC